MPHPTPKLTLAIAGGGIAGLALAAALERKHTHHITYTVYEAVPAYRDVGAGLALHRNAINAMSCLGPQVTQAYFTHASQMGKDLEAEMWTEVVLAQGEYMGETVAELGRAKGRMTVARAELVRGLRGLVPDERVPMGRRVKGVKEVGEKVEVEFEEGESVSVDLVIGADGCHSRIRRWVLGEEDPAGLPVNHDGWQIYRTLVDCDEAIRQGVDPKWTKTVPILLGPRGHINCMPLNKGTKLSAGVAVRGAKFTADGKTPELDPTIYDDYSDEARAIVNLVAKDTSASWNAADHDHAHTFCRGRVVLMGDSAHASLPFAGNGAAQALEDAAVLDALFTQITSSTQIPAALSSYDAIRRPRSQAVVDLARKFGRIYAYAEDDMHRDPVRMKRFFAEAASYTNAFDVAGQNQRAVDLFLPTVDAAASSPAFL